MENFCKTGIVETKTVGQMSLVLRNPSGHEKSAEIAYFVCRGEKTEGSLRHDVTAVKPGLINGEFLKTFGHYHSGGFPELFEVLDGKCLTLLQKDGSTAGEISEVYLVATNKGEKIIIPPDYGFCNINIGHEELLLSNWVDIGARNVYDAVNAFHGLCYYALKGEGNIPWRLEKNSSYGEAAEPIRLKPLGLAPELSNLDFLRKPGDYACFLPIFKLYEKA